MHLKNLLLIAIFLSFGCMSSYSQDIKFTVEVSSDTLLAGNYFEIRFIIENATGEFEPPAFKDFLMVGGPNQSSSYSMINGKVTQSASYSYFLEPKDIGDYIIGPAYIDTGEEVLETPPIEVIVMLNPDNIIQNPHQLQKKKDIAPGKEEKEVDKPGKKRKVYKM